MLSSILGIISAAAAIAGGVLAYKNSANRQRRNAEKDVRKIAENKAAKNVEIEAAVFTNDDDKVNDLTTRILAPVLCFAACCEVFVGCASKPATVYVPTDRRIETCTNSIGIVCKAVPNAVFAELLEKAQELKDLKTEMAVDKRLNK